jgi:hypothetical protein
MACAPEMPARVFVPGDSFSERIEVRTGQGDSARVSVGEPVTLHARRFSGPWIDVSRESVTPDVCWWASVPVGVEEEVAGNLRWIVQPTGSAEFNIDFRADLSREVRFSIPGRYVLVAESSGWCSDPYIGDSLYVEVAAR